MKFFYETKKLFYIHFGKFDLIRFLFGDVLNGYVRIMRILIFDILKVAIFEDGVNQIFLCNFLYECLDWIYVNFLPNKKFPFPFQTCLVLLFGINTCTVFMLLQSSKLSTVGMK